MKLSAPKRIGEIAEMLGEGWSYQRTKLWLLRLHRESGEKLLDGGPDGQGGWTPYTCSLARLFQVRPDLFDPPPGLEARVEELESDKATDRQQLHQIALAIGALRRDRPKSMLRVA